MGARAWLRRRPGAALAALLAGSLATAASMVGAYFWTRARAYSQLDFAFEGDPLIAVDRELGFVAYPGGVSLRRQPAAGISFHVYNSRLGARVNAPGELTPPRVDVVAIGCSFTWGHGIESDDTYPQLLARQLGVSVANLAFGSYGTLQSVQVLRRNLSLRPRVVVYGFIAEHLARNLSPCASSYAPTCLGVPIVEFADDGAPAIRLPDTSGFAANAAFYTEFFSRPGMSWRKLWLAARGDWARAAQQRRPNRAGDASAQRQSLAYLLAELHAVTRAAGAKLLVVHIPRVEAGATEPAPTMLKDALAGLPPEDKDLVDLAPAIAAHHARNQNGLVLGAMDAHPNAAAHRLIADELTSRLRRLGWLTASPTR